MDKIILTQKDADFILTYIRADLERQNKRYDLVVENEKKINRAKSLIEKEPITDFLTELTRASIDEFYALYKKQTDIAVKCIELLTTGSSDV